MSPKSHRRDVRIDEGVEELLGKPKTEPDPGGCLKRSEKNNEHPEKSDAGVPAAYEKDAGKGRDRPRGAPERAERVGLIGALRERGGHAAREIDDAVEWAPPKIFDAASVEP